MPEFGGLRLGFMPEFGGFAEGQVFSSWGSR